MRVVVVGATGNVGTALVELLSADEAIELVMALARRPPERTGPKTVFHPFDVTRDDLAFHLAGAEAVVHLAWTFQPARRPQRTWQVNVEGTARVLRACAEAGVRTFVHASSIGAYSPAPGRVVDESAPTDGLPTAAYGREKAYVERLLDVFEATHPEVRTVRMRPAFTFQRASGPQQLRLFAGPLVPAGLLRPGALPVLPYPSGLRLQALHSRDAARAYALALKRPVRGPFNLAARPVVEGPDLAALLETRPVALPPGLVRAALAAGWASRLVPVGPTLFDLAMALPEISTARAREELGWEPEVSSLAALGEALEGMRAGAGSSTAPLSPGGARARLAEGARRLDPRR